MHLELNVAPAVEPPSRTWLWLRGVPCVLASDLVGPTEAIDAFGLGVIDWARGLALVGKG